MQPRVLTCWDRAVAVAAPLRPVSNEMPARRRRERRETPVDEDRGYFCRFEKFLPDMTDPLVWIRGLDLLAGSALQDRPVMSVEDDFAAVFAGPLAVRATALPLVESHAARVVRVVALPLL